MAEIKNQVAMYERNEELTICSEELHKIITTLKKRKATPTTDEAIKHILEAVGDNILLDAFLMRLEEDGN